MADEVVSVQRSNGVGVQVQDQIIPRASLADEIGSVQRSDPGSINFQVLVFSRRLRWGTKSASFNADVVLQNLSSSRALRW